MGLPYHVEATLNIDFPGLTLEQARLEANKRALEALEEVRRIEALRLKLEYDLDHAKQAYFEADRAETLFQNALEEDQNESS